MKTAYPTIISPDTEGWYLASVPDIGLQTQGRSMAGAIDEAGHMSADDIEPDIEDALQRLFHPHNPTAYKALQELEKASALSDRVYPYMDRFAQMLDSNNSYIRTRGLRLIAHNARWDAGNKIDGLIDSYLRHIADPKPVTARQCIKLLPVLARYKPELREDILSALLKADTSIYGASMRPLVSGDIVDAIADIRAL